MGKFLFVLGLIQLILPITEILEIKIKGLTTSVSIIFFIVTIGGVIYMNTGERFKK